MPEDFEYRYRAVLKRVVDGDTLDLDINLGFSVVLNQRFRLEGVNTPELHSSDPAERARAQQAKGFLENLLTGADLVVVTKKDKQEKYGRYLCTLWVGKEAESVNSHLITAGHAVACAGGKR